MTSELESLYANCRLCPRQCGVDRLAGEIGACGESAVCRLASVGPHFGEEPAISGRHGSGTFFFTGCPCRCFFCQNHQISLAGMGRETSSEDLLDQALNLIASGVHNLNLVTPTHFQPHVMGLVRELRRRGLQTPVVYNSSGYELASRIAALAECVDIFLPDFKFAFPALAQHVMQAEDYPERALESLSEMISAKGFLTPFDESGEAVAQAGVLVRHLVLPGQVDNSLAVLRLLRQEFGRMLPVSIMSQYRPMPACRGRGEFSRAITAREYREVCELIGELDFRQVYCQPDFTETGFVPDFARSDPFPGNVTSPRQT